MCTALLFFSEFYVVQKVYCLCELGQNIHGYTKSDDCGKLQRLFKTDALRSKKLIIVEDDFLLFT